MPKFKTTVSAQRERARQVCELLNTAYPDATCSLNHRTPLQLLVATILSAQCTDDRVNIVTKDLFKKYKKAQDFLAVPQEEMEEDIRTCGFYRQKTKSIRKTCQALVDRFGGKVPDTMDELITLDGVGRKTANVVLGTCFGVPGVIVDTHCKRLSARFGFTKNSDPDKIEQDMMKLLPPECWTQYSHLTIYHGRAICQARGPKCSACPVCDLCPFPETREGKKVAK
jgi:endonuclease III